MTWGQRVRALWPFGKNTIGPDAADARDRADLSQLRAQADLIQVVRLRAESDHVARELLAHNVANQYDDFLRKVVQGRD
jgi:hypothetical protein